MKRDRKLVAAIAAAILLFVALNVLAAAALRGARLDLTDEKRFTLSPATERLLATLDEEIVLQLFAAKQALRADPYLGEHATRAEELLREYVSRSGGKVRLEVLDPEPYSEVEDQAVSRGVRGFVDPRGGGNVYLGLVGKNSTDGVEVLPFLHPEESAYLEYEVSRLVQRLAGAGRPKIGLVTALPVEGEAPGPSAPRNARREPWVVLQQLRGSFDVETIALAGVTRIPDDIDTLLVAHPRGISENALYAIDQFVLRGGRLIAFVDPWCESDPGDAPPDDPWGGAMAQRGSDLGPLLAAWGARLVAGQVAGDPEFARPVTYQGASGRPERGRFLPYLRLAEGAFDPDELLTRRLASLHLAYSGILEPIASVGTRFTPVLRTSARGAPIPVERVRFPDPARILADFPEQGAELVLAARLSGDVSSAYPDGPPAGGEAQGEHLTASRRSIQVVLVADADLLADRMWVDRGEVFGQQFLQRSADNGDFVLNAVELLAGGGDLVELRGRGRAERPFDVVVALQRASEERFRAEEQRLIEEERRMGQRIEELLRGQGANVQGGYVILPPELQAELQELREERERTRVRLREVRLSLNREVDRLGARLRWIHIGALPGAVALGALALAGLRSRARKGRSKQ